MSANVWRPQYLDRLRLLKDQKVIKVITGIRRCGKSTLLELFREDLTKQGVKSKQIQSFNFEEAKNFELRDWRALNEEIERKLVPTEMNYIFLDEIQKVEHFEEMVDSLFVKENVDLYLTGSNAFLLSGELATLLTGRYISIHVLPFSFKEYMSMFPDEPNTDRLFGQYLTSSSFPEVVTLSKLDEKLGNDYLRDVYNTIVNKDIAGRYEIRERADFEKVVKFVFDNIGNPLSARSISEVLKRNEETVAHGTVRKFLEYLANSYLIYPASRYDIKGKKLLSTNDKYYVADLGMRNILLGSSQESDLGHRLENVVYLELLRRGEGEVFVGKADDGEVDFVVQKAGGGREYYQVAYRVNGQPETLKRELAPLRRIRDNYPKMLLTMDLAPEEFEGIEKVNVIDWLQR